MGRERFALAALLLATVGVRLVHLDQPIVENYVGRQVPTAMVARNLERGSGFFRPQLDTGPFPNLFLVEPPIFASLVVLVRGLTGLSIGAAGRAVSAMSTSLAAWGLFGLVRRRDGVIAGLFAVAAFGLFPITLRYGRACQPDMLMIGLLVAGLRLWDDFRELGGRLRPVVAWSLIAAGLAVKIVAASILIPLIFAILRSTRSHAPRGNAVCDAPRPPRRVHSTQGEIRGAENTAFPRGVWERVRGIFAALSTLLPAILWYGYAASILQGAGSRASADNAAIWASSLGPLALLRPDAIVSAGRFLALRSFTPLGFLFATLGIFRRCDANRFWIVWSLSALAGLAMVGGKLHHEYYWLALAPVAAAGVGRYIDQLSGTFLHSFWFESRSGRRWNADESTRLRMPYAAAFATFAALAAWQSSTTFRTPREWASLPEASAEIARIVPRGSLVVAPEAVLFAADYRGCRLEFEPRAMTRAAGEWRGSIDPSDPLALVEFYRSKGARFVADLTTPADPPSRRALHEAIRRRYNVRVDRDGVLIAELTDRPGTAPCPPPPPP